MSKDGFTLERLRESMNEFGQTAAGGSRCPEQERIWLSARGELPLPDNREVLTHVAECPSCAMSWRIARDMGTGPAEAQTVRGSRRPLWAGLAAAAVIVAAVGLGILLRQGPGAGPETPYRAQENIWLRSAIEDDTVLPRDEFVLRWEAAPEGSVYTVLVMSTSLEILANGVGLASSEFRVPADALASLPSGSTVLWHVTANLPDGRFVESESYLVRVE